MSATSDALRKYAVKGMLPVSLALSLMCGTPGIADAYPDDDTRMTTALTIHLHYDESTGMMDVSTSPNYKVGARMYTPDTFHHDHGMFIAPRIATGISGRNPAIRITEFFLSDDNTLYKIDSMKNPHLVTSSESVAIPEAVAATLRNKDSSLGADTVYTHYAAQEHDSVPA